MVAGTKETRYKRATAPLDAEAQARLWDGGGGGGEGWPGKLEELVDEFYNNEAAYRGREEEEEDEVRPVERWRQEMEAELHAAAADPMVEWIRANADAAIRGGGPACNELLRRRIARRLRNRGLDAGICMCRWDTTAGVPAGCHEYIDVVVNGEDRYIVEINLVAEFEIARPTDDYTEQLSSLPKVFVGMPRTLEVLNNLMCLAAGESMKNAGMHVPPWRRRKYMYQKWFGDYRRWTDTALDSGGCRGKKFWKAESICREGV